MFKKNKDDNKKILESRRLIKEAQETIRLEKMNIKKSKREDFKKTKFYKFMKKTFKFINFEKNTYSFSEVLVVTVLSLLVGAFACLSVISIAFDGGKYLRSSKELSKLIEVYETITNNFNTHKNNDDTSHRHMTESEYWQSRMAAFYDNYDSPSVNSDGTPYYKWRRRGMWALLRIYGVTIKSGLKTTQTYTLNSHNTRNQWTPAHSVLGAFSYDEVKWITLTYNSTHPGWEIQYKPKSTSATQLYASIVYLCADQYVRINDIPRKIYWKAATADHGAGYWIDGLGWAVDL